MKDMVQKDVVLKLSSKTKMDILKFNIKSEVKVNYHANVNYNSLEDTHRINLPEDLQKGEVYKNGHKSYKGKIEI